MIPVSFRTNLDIEPGEKFPCVLGAVPHVGDLVQSRLKWDGGCHLELEVCRVTWKFDDLRAEWYASVEMHLPKGRFRNLLHFNAWYEWVRGRIGSDEFKERYDKAYLASLSPRERQEHDDLLARINSIEVGTRTPTTD